MKARTWLAQPCWPEPVRRKPFPKDTKRGRLNEVRPDEVNRPTNLRPGAAWLPGPRGCLLGCLAACFACSAACSAGRLQGWLQGAQAWLAGWLADWQGAAGNLSCWRWLHGFLSCRLAGRLGTLPFWHANNRPLPVSLPGGGGGPPSPRPAGGGGGGPGGGSTAERGDGGLAKVPFLLLTSRSPQSPLRQSSPVVRPQKAHDTRIRCDVLKCHDSTNQIIIIA